jgi:hypothetical protein
MDLRPRGRGTDARTRVDTRRAATGPRGHEGGEIRVSPIKEGALPLFPHFQLNPVEYLGFEMVCLHFIFSLPDHWVFGWESTTDGGGGFVVL